MKTHSNDETDRTKNNGPPCTIQHTPLHPETTQKLNTNPLNQWGI